MLVLVVEIDVELEEVLVVVIEELLEEDVILLLELVTELEVLLLEVPDASAPAGTASQAMPAP